MRQTMLLGWFVFLTLGLSAATAQAQADSPGSSAQKKTIAEATSLLRQAKGNVVLFHVYASWCPACRMQFPDLNKLSGRYRKHPFKLLALSLDEDSQALAKFLKEQRWQGQSMRLVPGTQDFFAAMKEAGMKEFKDGIPYTAVFDMRGRCVKEFTGVTEFKTFYRAIDDIYLAATPKAKPAETAKAPAVEKPAVEKPTPEDKTGGVASPGSFTTVSADKLSGSDNDDTDGDFVAGASLKSLLFIIAGVGAVMLIAAGAVLQMRQGQVRA